jgi:hypothetical protein
MRFRIARFNKKSGLWITNRRQLARIYLKSYLIVDLITTIPWELLGFFFKIKCFSCKQSGQETNARMWRVLKLVKVFKLGRIFKTSRLFEKIKNNFRLKSSEYMLLKYSGVLLIALHWTACAWGIFPQLDTTGTAIEMRHQLEGSYADYTEFDGRNWVSRMSDKMGHKLSPSDKYALSIDFALACMCMGYGTVDARTVTEVWFTMFCMMIAGGVYAYVIGGVCESLSNDDPVERQYREAVDSLNGYLRTQSNVDEEVQRQCYEYLRMYKRQIEASVYNRVLQLFTPRLKQQLAAKMWTQLVKDAHILKWAASEEEEYFQMELAICFECAIFPEDENIFSFGEVSDCMYVVCKGMVRCASPTTIANQDGGGRYGSWCRGVALFAQGHCFGWEMIRNVCFPDENKYTRINSAGSFTVSMLQKLSAKALRKTLAKPRLHKTAKKVKRAAQWCLVRDSVVKLGSAIVHMKANAGQPMTHAQKKLAKKYYNSVALKEAKRKAFARTRWKALSSTLHGETAEGTVEHWKAQTSEGQERRGRESDAKCDSDEQHLRVLRGFGGGFLQQFQAQTDLSDVSLRTSTRTGQTTEYEDELRQNFQTKVEVIGDPVEVIGDPPDGAATQ